MARRALVYRFVLIVALATLTAFPASSADEKPEDVVGRHLNSIASPEIRAAANSRVVEGTFKFRMLVGGSGEGAGTWGQVSLNRQSRFVMRFGQGDWKGEQFVSDGSRTAVAITTASHKRSDLGTFVYDQSFLINEGLLGGELSTSWALQNLEANHARIENLGIKKIDGKDLIALQYFSKSNHDMQVRIYLDPANYHHVLTVYSLRVEPHMSGNIIESWAQKEVRYTIEERFSDFQTEDSITLPRDYQLQFTEEVQDGTTRIYSWDMTAKAVRENVPLDPANFVVK